MSDNKAPSLRDWHDSDKELRKHQQRAKTYIFFAFIFWFFALLIFGIAFIYKYYL